jgi:putative DNA primase/helicase
MESSTKTSATSNGLLLPQHLAELRASGLNDDTIHLAGIYSETDRKKLAALLNRSRWSSTWGDALVFPFNIGGQVVLHRVKPTNPPKRKGGVAKYLSPSGQGSRLYIPPAAVDAIRDVHQRLLITEGEKKSLAACQFGFPCVGLTGVDCWHAKDSTALIPDLAAIPWEGRDVLIVFDSDLADNDHVLLNESLLAAALSARGAKVRVIRLPGGPDGNKVGLDDFLVAHGDRELLKLIEQAEDPEPPDSGELRRPAKEMDPATEAERIAEEAKDDNGVPRLRFWRGTFWLWSRGAYRELESDEIRAKIIRHLRPAFFGIGTGHVGNVEMHLQAVAELSPTVEPPSWLSPKEPTDWPTHEIVACRNGLIHLPTLAADDPAYFAPLSPRLFTHSATDFDFDDNPPKPERWLSFLSQLWSDDQQSIDALSEWFGLCLTPDMSYHKILLIVGPTRCGKGTIFRVLRGIIGHQNTCSPGFGEVAGDFGLAPFFGKSLACIADARLGSKADSTAVIERLLRVSGEDPVDINRKHKPSIASVKLSTRIMLLSNELPRLRDASGAITDRFVLLRIKKNFLGKEDRNLTRELLEERAGILWWAIAGWMRLNERGRFIQPDSCLETFADLRDQNSPVGVFVRERCELDPNYTTPKENVYQAFIDWEKSRGTKFTPSPEDFSKLLYAATQEAVESCRQREGDDRFYSYKGIRLRFD